MKRALWVILAWTFTGLALAGLFLPLLPCTPFLLLAAYCATRGSEPLHRWLYEHPRLGPLLRDWDERQAIPLAGKLGSAAGLIAAAFMAFQSVHSAWGRGLIVAGMLAISAYVWSRPSPARS